MNWNREGGERGEGEGVFHQLVHSPNPTTAGSGLGQSQIFGIPYKFPMQVADPSYQSHPCCLFSRNWDQEQSQILNPGTLMKDTSILTTSPALSLGFLYQDSLKAFIACLYSPQMLGGPLGLVVMSGRVECIQAVTSLVLTPPQLEDLELLS